MNSNLFRFVDYRKSCNTNGPLKYGINSFANINSILSQLFDGTNLKYSNFSNVLKGKKVTHI